MQVRFKGRVWKSGNSSVVTIPFDYIDNGMIPTDTEIQFIAEVADSEV